MGNPAAHKARKRFGQHFLHDQQIIDAIVRAINPQPEDNLVEIGPGQGALTFPLLHQSQHLTAVELDRDLIPLLAKKAATIGDLKLVNADVLEFELNSLGADRRYRLAGNLPYNISTPLMFHLLESIELIIDMHFMVQKEVALRIVAKPGDPNYGRLSVMMQYQCQCDYLIDVGPECFTPAPRVDSAVIRLTPQASPLFDVGDYPTFYQVVQTAFGQRRKTISNSLKKLMSREQLIACEIDPGLRAEKLSLADFANLSRNCHHD